MSCLLLSLQRGGAHAATVVRPKVVNTKCTSKEACFPWQPKGPKCGRASKLNLRFVLDVAPENWIRSVDADLQNVTTTTATFAFCPLVDELQAFNLTGAIPLAAMYDTLVEDPNAEPGTGALVVQPEFSVLLEGFNFISVFGMGDLDNIYYPNASGVSYGSAAIVFNETIDPDKQTSICNDGEFGIVAFLVLNITLDKGLYKYYEEFPAPYGTGFAPTCDEFGICLFGPGYKCFGEKGRQNCGKCLTPEKAMQARLQIWTSYYGTDAFGRKLRSGASNPLNFRQFSGGGVQASMTNAYENFQNGETIDESDFGASP